MGLDFWDILGVFKHFLDSGPNESTIAKLYFDRKFIEKRLILPKEVNPKIQNSMNKVKSTYFIPT